MGGTTWVSCGVLRAELEELHRQGKIRGTLCFIDSLLHMNPEELEKVIESELIRLEQETDRLVLVYGDCCGRMLDLVRQFRVGRVDAINCAQMLLGRARYRELMRQQSFLLLSEWVSRWKHAMGSALGLSPEMARDLMRDTRSELVYLETGLSTVSVADLEACANYAGLPLRIESVSLDNFLALLLEADFRAGPGARGCNNR